MTNLKFNGQENLTRHQSLERYRREYLRQNGYPVDTVFPTNPDEEDEFGWFTAYHLQVIYSVCKWQVLSMFSLCNLENDENLEPWTKQIRICEEAGRRPIRYYRRRRIWCQDCRSCSRVYDGHDLWKFWDKWTKLLTKWQRSSMFN